MFVRLENNTHKKSERAGRKRTDCRRGTKKLWTTSEWIGNTKSANERGGEGRAGINNLEADYRSRFTGNRLPPRES